MKPKTKPQGKYKGGIWYPNEPQKKKLNLKHEIKELGLKKRKLSAELRSISQELKAKVEAFFGWAK